MNYNFKSDTTQEKKRLQIILITFFAITVSLFNPIKSRAQNLAQQQENPILGEWFPLSTSRSGLGMAITLSSDGKVKNIHGAFVTYKYKFESDTLSMIFSNNPEIKNNTTVDKTKLIIRNMDTITELTRVSSDPDSGIIGRWKGEHYTGATQIITYTASQNAYLSVPMSSTEETFKIKGEIIEFSGTSNRSYQWFVDGNKLTLKSMDNEKTFNYVKIN